MLSITNPKIRYHLTMLLLLTQCSALHVLDSDGTHLDLPSNTTVIDITSTPMQLGISRLLSITLDGVPTYVITIQMVVNTTASDATLHFYDHDTSQWYPITTSTFDPVTKTITAYLTPTMFNTLNQSSVHPGNNVQVMAFVLPQSVPIIVYQSFHLPPSPYIVYTLETQRQQSADSNGVLRIVAPVVVVSLLVLYTISIFVPYCTFPYAPRQSHALYARV
jgi:hypothetical protein